MIKNLPKLLISTLLAAMGTLGTIFSFTSAFSISFSLPVVSLVCLAASLIFTFCFMHKKALWVLIPAILAVGAAALFTELFSSMSPTFVQLVHDILSRFSTAYPNFSFVIPAAPDPSLPQSTTLFFSVVAVLLTVWIAWGVGYRSCLITVAGTLPFLLICVIINDTPPHATPLIMLLTVWVTVLLSRERPGEPASMDALRTGLIMMAVVLLLGVIGIAYPKDDTRNEQLPQLLQSILDQLPGPMQNALSRDTKGAISDDLGADTAKTLDLTQQGTRQRKDTVMLQISATQSGPLYLRGAAKDIYTGTSWESSDEATQAQSVYAQTSLGTAFGSDSQAAVQIENLKESASVLFAPYGYISCTSAEDILSDLRININEDDYVVYYWPGVRSLDITTSSYANADYDQYVQDHCLQLPEDTRQELYNLALEYGYEPDMSTAQTVAWVAEFVRNIGTYKLNVSRQPVNFDFVLYFLEQSQEGYCVHFATAAAVMYRALGIPSRYASGYRVTVTDDSMVTDVTDQDTHAWAEIYLSGLGWIPIEATPGFGETSMLPELEQDVETPPAQTPSPTPEPMESVAEPAGPSEAAVPSPSPEGAGDSSQQESSPSPSPSPVSGGSQIRKVGSRILLALVIAIPALLLLTALTLAIRRLILRRRRRHAVYAADPNQAVLNLWLYAQQLALWGASLTEEQEALALKAKFSQHTITPEELEPYRQSILDMARLTPLTLTRWKRFSFKWLHGLDWKEPRK